MTRFVVTVALFRFLTAETAALELSIVEIGPELDADVGLWVRDLGDRFFEVNRLVSPSGEVFTPDSILEEGGVSNLLIRFDSVADAIDYVEGTWQATMAPGNIPPPPPDPATDTFEFSIEGISLAAINRTAPSLLTPSPGEVIKNGSTFNFGWDYVTSGEAPNQTSIVTIPQFDPISGRSRSIVSTPIPGRMSRSSGSTGIGDEKFTHTRTNVPGADENRFLLTLEAAEAALPLDVEITLGSYISLADRVFPPQSAFRPQVGFFYSREIDPFFVTLSTVPEPSSIGLVIVFVIGGSLFRSRLSDTSEIILRATSVTTRRAIKSSRESGRGIT